MAKHKGPISIKEFARRVDVDHNVVLQALKEGRIEYAPGGKKINFETQSVIFQERENAHVDENDVHAIKTPLGKVRFRKELAAAKLKEFELKIEQAKYLDREQAKAAIFKFSRVVRDAIITIPERVAAAISSSLKSRFTVLLTKEGVSKEIIERILKKFSDAEVERLIHSDWVRESKEVLESLEKPPIDFNKLSKHKKSNVE